jgi:hypothetical protein
MYASMYRYAGACACTILLERIYGGVAAREYKGWNAGRLARITIWLGLGGKDRVGESTTDGMWGKGAIQQTLICLEKPRGRLEGKVPA